MYTETGELTANPLVRGLQLMWLDPRNAVPLLDGLSLDSLVNSSSNPTEQHFLAVGRVDGRGRRSMRQAMRHQRQPQGDTGDGISTGIVTTTATTG